MLLQTSLAIDCVGLTVKVRNLLTVSFVDIGVLVAHVSRGCRTIRHWSAVARILGEGLITTGDITLGCNSTRTDIRDLVQKIV